MIQKSSLKTRRYSREQAAQFLFDYRQSRLTQAEFCRRRGLALWRLRRWLGMDRRGKLPGPVGAKTPELIRLAWPQMPDKGTGWAYELDWQRRQLRFGPGFEARQLRQLLEMLGVC